MNGIQSAIFGPLSSMKYLIISVNETVENLQEAVQENFIRYKYPH
jgi:hypothetical protein